MKLLIVSNMYPSAKDSVYGTFVKVFADRIADLNKNGTVDLAVCRGRSRTLLSKIGKYIVFYLRTLFCLLFRNYDLVYVHTITYPIVPIRIAIWFRTLPLVFNVHGSDVLTSGRLAAILKGWAQPLLCQSRLIVAPSEFFKRILMREFPDLCSEKIYVSPSGGVADCFYEPNMTADKTHSSLLLGYVSRIDRLKGWDVFLKAIQLLVQRGFDCRGIIVGRGAQEQEMMDMISKLDLSEAVDYVGPVSYEQLPMMYRSFDLFVFPSQLEESLGLVGLEAMACRVPVICSRIGGMTDYVVSGKNGFFFTPGNADDLAAKVEQYWNLSLQQKNCIKENAHATAIGYRSDTSMKKLYDRLLMLL